MDPPRSLSLSDAANASGIDEPVLSNGAVLPKKRPGPKRDARPALSEKLERNRQAQRTHRERKERYTKDLEAAIMQKNELFVEACAERDAAVLARDRAMAEGNKLAAEVERLRELLRKCALSNTIPCLDQVDVRLDTNGTSSTGHSRRESASDAEDKPVVPSKVNADAIRDLSLSHSPTAISTVGSVLSVQTALDYDELGLDFVLTLERPCMGHIQYLSQRAHHPSGQATVNGEAMPRPTEVPDDGENLDISGHALMATSPTLTQVMQSSLYKPISFPDLKKADLAKLLQLSSNLGTGDQELPPIKAWQQIALDSRCSRLRMDEYELLKNELLKRVRCYRFGAVVEFNDIDQVLNSLFGPKTLHMESSQ